MEMKNILLYSIIVSCLVAYVLCDSTKTINANKTGLQILSLPTDSPENSFSPALNGDNENGTTMCQIYIPPIERNCHKKKEPDCHDTFSELIEHDSNCISILQTCQCATYDDDRNVIEYGRCVYNCFYSIGNSSYFENNRILPSEVGDWNDEVCGKFHRRGSLCGSCQVNTYLMAYSYNLTCVKCGNHYKLNWLKYLFFAFFPLTIFYFTILLLHINIASSPLQGYTLNAQLISAPALARMFLLSCKNSVWCNLIPFIGNLYGIWNLDFFRFYNLGICLKTDSLETLTLDLIVAVYPLVLIAITYFFIQLYDANFTTFIKIWKPFILLSTKLKKNWNLKTSTIDSFATFLFLSNIKFLSVCTDILIPVQVTSTDPLFNQTTSSWRMYYDASIEYFGSKHRPFAITALVVLVVMVILPILLLILYPFKVFQNVLNKFPPRWQIIVKTFMESFQGCYKDGTGRYKADYRWAFYSLLVPSFFLVFWSMLFISFVIIMIDLEPFKDHTMNKSITVFIILAANLVVSGIGRDLSSLISPFLFTMFYPVLFIASCLPHLFMISLLLKPLFHNARIRDFFSKFLF